MSYLELVLIQKLTLATTGLLHVSDSSSMAFYQHSTRPSAHPQSCKLQQVDRSNDHSVLRTAGDVSRSLCILPSAFSCGIHEVAMRHDCLVCVAERRGNTELRQRVARVRHQLFHSVPHLVHPNVSVHCPRLGKSTASHDGSHGCLELGDEFASPIVTCFFLGVNILVRCIIIPLFLLHLLLAVCFCRIDPLKVVCSEAALSPTLVNVLRMALANF